MYTLLIADDEPLIRNGIKNSIDWQSLGFSKIFLAEDGQEALDIIRVNKVDLVLTDIVMPFMDGLELTKILSKEYPDIHIVILTGHEDFEYARQSVDLGVKNYILKPAGADTMYKKMSEICEKLHMENRKKEYISSIKKQLNQSAPVLRSQLLNHIVCTATSNLDMYLERCKSFQVELGDGPYEVALVELELSEISAEDYDLYLFASQNIAKESVGDEHFVFEDGRERVVILFRCSLFGDDAHDIVYQTLCVIQKAIYSYIKIGATCGSGSMVDAPERLHDSYLDAKKALECKYSLGGDNVYDIEDLGYLEKSFFYPQKQIKNLINCIIFKGIDEVREAVTEVMNCISVGRSLSTPNIKMVYIEMVTSFLRELSNLKEVSEKIWSDGFDFYQAIDRLATPEKMKERLMLFAGEIHKEMQSVQTNSSIQIIEKVKNYVNQNYKDPELSLNSAAEFASVSTGYLSGLFKKEAGTNFVKYLTDVRMKKSMELLRTTDMKTYEIAFETGFSNPHYFSISFKKYTGMSPSEFRQRS